MFYIILALLMFMAAVTAHILFCRQTRQTGLHAKVFILTAVVFLGFYVGASLGVSLNPLSFWGMPFKITGGLIYILLVPIYLCFYVLTQLTSPSKRILSFIALSGDASHEQILAAVERERFIESRLSDLCASGCVIQREDRYILTSEGRKIATILDAMQWILGRNVGG